MNLILKYRHAKRSLDMNADHEKLLNVPQMIQFADQLLPTTCEDLMEIIQEADFGEHGSVIEKYFLHLEKVYERSSVLIRSRDARQTPARGGSRQDQGRPGRKTDLESDQRSFEVQTKEGASSKVRTQDARVADEHSTTDGGGEDQDEGDSGDGYAGEDRDEISSLEGGSDGEGGSDEGRAPSKPKGAGSNGNHARSPTAWECPRCNNLNSAAWVKCNGTLQGEEGDVCLLTRPCFERYGVARTRSEIPSRGGDWNCFYCGNKNFQFRDECNRCKLPKNDAQSDKFRQLEGEKRENSDE